MVDTGPRELRLPKHLSYSALHSYIQCGEQFRLQRLRGYRDTPNWAAIAGSAIHEITASLDLEALGADDPIPDFVETLDRMAAEEAERAGIQVSEIRHTGRVSKEWPDKWGREYWLGTGPEYIQKWVDWRDAQGWELWTLPDGMPAIEFKVSPIIGGRPLVGYVDRAFVKGTGELIAIDIKSGRVPPSHFQLGAYAAAMHAEFGVRPSVGAYWIAKSGDLTQEVDLSVMPDEFIHHMFASAWRGIDEGIFLPNDGAFCSTCSVKRFCRIKGGHQVNEVPIIEEIPRWEDVTQVTQEIPSA